VTPNPAVISAGQSTFQRHCAGCHGTDARGNGATAPKWMHPPNLVDNTRVYGKTDGEIFLVIRDGLGPASQMKGFRTRLSEPEMWGIVHFLRSIGPADNTPYR
jgi:mono/diheme cytochrome c family protein